MPTTPTCLKITINPGRNASGQLNAPSSEVVTYLVQYDLPTSVAQDLASATDGTTSIPQAWSTLPGYSYLYLQKIDIKQHPENGCFWDVVCTYGTAVPQQQQKKPPTATKYNVDVSGTLVPRQYPVTMDATGNPIVSSGGDPITGLTRTDYDEQITVSFHTRAPDWTTIDTCKGKSNSGTVSLTINGSTRSMANNTLKLENVNWNLVYDADGSKCTRMDYVLMYRPETWTDKVADMGYHTKSNGTISEITIGAVNVANGLAAGDSAATIKGTPTYLKNGAILTNNTTVSNLTFTNVLSTSFSTLLDAELVT